MLRATVAALLVANVAFWTYSQGHLRAWGLDPDSEREPQRLQQQVAPETLRLIGPPPALAAGDTTNPPTPGTTGDPTAPLGVDDPAEPTPADPNASDAAPPGPTSQTAGTTAPANGSCWQATGINANLAPLLRGALDKQPELAASWSLDPGTVPARWIVYQGKFTSADALQRRRAELRAAKVDHRDVNNPALQPGLALGTYSTAAAAGSALEALKRQGVLDARVVQERAESTQFTLRLPAITDAQRKRILSLALLGEATLRPCP